MLKQAFGYEALSRTQTHEWYKRVKESRPSIGDSDHTGWPSTSKNEEDIQKIWKVIRSNHRLIIHEVAEEDGI